MSFLHVRCKTIVTKVFAPIYFKKSVGFGFYFFLAVAEHEGSMRVREADVAVAVHHDDDDMQQQRDQQDQKQDCAAEAIANQPMIAGADAEALQQLIMFMYPPSASFPHFFSFFLCRVSCNLPVYGFCLTPPPPTCSADLQRQRQAAAAAGTWDERCNLFDLVTSDVYLAPILIRAQRRGGVGSRDELRAASGAEAVGHVMKPLLAMQQ